ncbi:unnamed protein product [marine sediment metagenome]|uniref:Uncharacterized protein n=1 Tax=marine sediment metagenome TaxID=412755 RepID=X0UEI8_9ZZZZ
MENKIIKQTWNGNEILVHTTTYHQNNEVTLGVWCPQELNIGDELHLCMIKGFMKIKEIVQNRDHNGVFENPDHKWSSYWKLTCHFNAF